MLYRMLVVAAMVAPAVAIAQDAAPQDDTADLVAILAGQAAPNFKEVRKAADTLKSPPPVSVKPLETRHG
ncbi:MAG: hypothetical protein HYZ27_12500, partial [Deltaproteobacteria bacterium]|nr:hypothetical protein [Deltaproteobacteria bacterium]